MHRPHDEFGPCVGVAVFVLRCAPGAPAAAEAWEVLLLRRAFGDFQGRWCPVAGRTEIGEDALSAARRELAEETGLLTRGLEGVDYRAMIEARGRHGHLRVFAAFPEAAEAVSLDREHDEHAWLPVDEARARLSLREQRGALDAVVAQLLEPRSTGS